MMSGRISFAILSFAGGAIHAMNVPASAQSNDCLVLRTYVKDLQAECADHRTSCDVVGDAQLKMQALCATQRSPSDPQRPSADRNRRQAATPPARSPENVTGNAGPLATPNAPKREYTATVDRCYSIMRGSLMGMKGADGRNWYVRNICNEPIEVWWSHDGRGYLLHKVDRRPEYVGDYGQPDDTFGCPSLVHGHPVFLRAEERACEVGTGPAE